MPPNNDSPRHQPLPPTHPRSDRGRFHPLSFSSSEARSQQNRDQEYESDSYTYKSGYESYKPSSRPRSPSPRGRGSGRNRSPRRDEGRRDSRYQLMLEERSYRPGSNVASSIPQQPTAKSPIRVSLTPKRKMLGGSPKHKQAHHNETDASQSLASPITAIMANATPTDKASALGLSTSQPDLTEHTPDARLDNVDDFEVSMIPHDSKHVTAVLGGLVANLLAEVTDIVPLKTERDATHQKLESIRVYAHKHQSFHKRFPILQEQYDLETKLAEKALSIIDEKVKLKDDALQKLVKKTWNYAIPSIVANLIDRPNATSKAEERLQQEVDYLKNQLEKTGQETRQRFEHIQAMMEGHNMVIDELRNTSHTQNSASATTERKQDDLKMRMRATQSAHKTDMKHAQDQVDENKTNITFWSHKLSQKIENSNEILQNLAADVSKVKQDVNVLRQAQDMTTKESKKHSDMMSALATQAAQATAISGEVHTQLSKHITAIKALDTQNKPGSSEVVARVSTLEQEHAKLFNDVQELATKVAKVTENYTDASIHEDPAVIKKDFVALQKKVAQLSLPARQDIMSSPAPVNVNPDIVLLKSQVNSLEEQSQRLSGDLNERLSVLEAAGKHKAPLTEERLLTLEKSRMSSPTATANTATLEKRVRALEEARKSTSPRPALDHSGIENRATASKHAHVSTPILHQMTKENLNAKLVELEDEVSNLQVAQEILAKGMAEEIKNAVDSRATFIENNTTSKVSAIAANLQAQIGKVQTEQSQQRLEISAQTVELDAIKRGANAGTSADQVVRTLLDPARDYLHTVVSNVEKKLISTLKLDTVSTSLAYLYTRTEAHDHKLNNITTRAEAHEHAIGNLQHRFDNISTGDLAAAMTHQIMNVVLPNVHTTERTVSEIRNSLGELTDKVLEVERKLGQGDYQSTTSALYAARSELIALADKVAKIVEQVGTMEGVATSLRSDVGLVQGGLFKVDNDVAALKVDHASVDTRVSKIGTDMSTLRQDVDAVSKSLAQLDNSGTVTTKFAATTEHLENLEARVIELKDEIAEYISDNNAAMAPKNIQLEADISQLRVEFNLMKAVLERGSSLANTGRQISTSSIAKDRQGSASPISSNRNVSEGSNQKKRGRPETQLSKGSKSNGPSGSNSNGPATKKRKPSGRHKVPLHGRGGGGGGSDDDVIYDPDDHAEDPTFEDDDILRDAKDIELSKKGGGRVLRTRQKPDLVKNVDGNRQIIELDD